MMRGELHQALLMYEKLCKDRQESEKKLPALANMEEVNLNILYDLLIIK